MSDDFLKKIASNSSANTNNPLNQLFQKKKNELGIKEEDKKETKEEELDGIENLGKTTTKNDFSFDNKDEAKTDGSDLPAKSMEKADIFSKEESVSADGLPAKSIEEQDIFSKEENISADDLPAKSMENADIFKDNSENNTDDELPIMGSSSTNELSFDDEPKKAEEAKQEISGKNPFDELTINFIIDLLKHNKPDEAIKLITDKKYGK